MAVNDSSKFFAGGWLRSNLEAHSGEYSILTTPIIKPYALKHKIRCVAPDSYINVSVWRKIEGWKWCTCCSWQSKRWVIFCYQKIAETSENGWEKLELDVYTPPDYKGDTLLIYVWNNSTDTVYFDDLIIERKAHKIYPEYNYDEGLNIVMDTSDYLRVMKKRKRCFWKGEVLQTSDNDWVKGIVVDNDKDNEG